MEPWLKAHLEARGVFDSDGVHRRVSSTHCQGCGKWVLRGLDSDRCALPVTVDIDPVDQVGEMLAVVNGLRTFDLIARMSKTAIGWQLDVRRPPHISRPRRWQVYSEHRCGLELPHAPQTKTWTPRPADPPF